MSKRPPNIDMSWEQLANSNYDDSKRLCCELADAHAEIERLKTDLDDANTGKMWRSDEIERLKLLRKSDSNATLERAAVIVQRIMSGTKVERQYKIGEQIAAAIRAEIKT